MDVKKERKRQSTIERAAGIEARLLKIIKECDFDSSIRDELDQCRRQARRLQNQLRRQAMGENP